MEGGGGQAAAPAIGRRRAWGQVSSKPPVRIPLKRKWGYSLLSAPSDSHCVNNRVLGLSSAGERSDVSLPG